jgi:hypothetical protein
MNNTIRVLHNWGFEFGTLGWSLALVLLASDTQTDVDMAVDEPTPSIASTAEAQASRGAKKTEILCRPHPCRIEAPKAGNE